MSHQTLHHFNFDEIKHISNYLSLIGDNDAVIVYANIFSKQQYKKIVKALPSQNISFIIINNTENIQTISYSQLIGLINTYHINLTWK